MKQKRRCGNCGSIDIRRTETDGPFPWKDYPAVYLHSPVTLTVCRSCGEHLGPVGEGALIDKAVEESIKTQLRIFVETLTRRERCTQVDIAHRIGIAPEYLSNIKRGVKVPKFSVFNFLKTMAINEQAFNAANPTVRFSAHG